MAALTRNSPLPEPISSSTGWSLPKRLAQSIGAAALDGRPGSIRWGETSIAGRERDIVRGEVRRLTVLEFGEPVEAPTGVTSEVAGQLGSAASS